MKYILRCTCGGVKSKMEAAMKVMLPNEPMPKEVKGGEAIAELASQYPNSAFGNHLLTLSKKHGRYCQFVEVTDKGAIIDARDLMTGRKLV